MNRYILLITATALLAVPVHLLQYDGLHRAGQGRNAISAIPLNVEKWKGRDVQLETWVYDLLETRSIIHRSYSNEGKHVFLSVVYYADTKVDFHAPEACLGAQGLELTKSSWKINLDNHESFTVNELTYQRENSRELVYYFYKAGTYLGNSYVNLRFKIAYNKLFSGNKSGSLIRISTPVEESTADAARQTLSEFFNAIYPFILSGL